MAAIANKVAAAVLLVVAMGCLVAESAVDCGLVTQELSPCVTAAISGSKPDPTCCTGIRDLYYKRAKQTADRQTICKCIKAYAGYATPTVVTNIGRLLAACKVSLPYKISPQLDCSTVR